MTAKSRPTTLEKRGWMKDTTYILFGIALMPFAIAVNWIAEINQYLRQRWFS